MAHIDPLSAHICELKGAIVLISPHLQEIRQELLPEIGFRQDPLYITLLTPQEYCDLNQPAIPKINLEHIYVLGAGSTNTGSVLWLVVVWNHGNRLRKKMKLAVKDFYITLSEESEDRVDRSIMSINGGMEKFLQISDILGEDAMDHVLALQPTPLHPRLASEMVKRFPDSYRFYIRLGDLIVHDQPKIAMVSYARALSLNTGLFTYVKRALLRLHGDVAWGPTVSRQELQDIKLLGLEKELLTPWKGEMISICRDRLWSKPAESRERFVYLGQELPRFFSWVYPHRLAGMSTPRSEADIDLLLDLGITTVLTLTAEQPLDHHWFAFKRIKNIFIPIENYDTPTIAEMDAIYEKFQHDSEGNWLVHCGGGKGRAGTVIACLIAMFGYEVEENAAKAPKLDAYMVIKEVRSMRPESIESQKQEKFISLWLSNRWREASEEEDTSNFVTSLDVHYDSTSFPRGLENKNVRTCCLVGIPGSGKSWLAQAIARRRPAPTVIVSQDESGSCSGCETALGQDYAEGTLLILDRCNPDAKGRQDWLSLSLSHEGSVAVYFDYSQDTCLRRVDRRIGHPTIRAGMGRNAVEHFSKSLTKPTLGEGFGAILTITSFAAAREAVLLLGGTPGLLKFPRTPHLVDLGATTSDDIVLPTQDLKGNITVEEKIDGANIGLAMVWNWNIRVQNRSHLVSSSDHPQFKALPSWIDKNREALQQILRQDELYPERFILYGEWVVAQHSIHYTTLPDSFLAFDFYDRQAKCFVSRRLLQTCLRGSGISLVPLICHATRLRTSQLIEMVERQSQFAEGRVEGVDVRIEDVNRRRTIARGKVVRSDFITGHQHWTKGPLTWNGILSGP